MPWDKFCCATLPVQPCTFDTLEGSYVIRLGAAPTRSLYIVRNPSDADKVKLNKFTLFDQSDMEKLTTSVNPLVMFLYHYHQSSVLC